MISELKRGGDGIWQIGVLVEVIGMGHSILVGRTIMFYLCIDQGGDNFSNFGTGSVVGALKKVEVEMGNLDFLAKRTDQTMASSSVHVTLLNVIDAEIQGVVSTRQIMTKFACETVLQVNQREHIVKNRWTRSGRGWVFKRGQGSLQKLRDVGKLGKWKLRAWMRWMRIPPP